MNDQACLHLCASCAFNAGGAVAALDRALSGAGLGFRITVSAASCLGPCDAPFVLALQGRGRAAYVFAGVRLPGDLEDVVATCHAYLASPSGWIEDARPCGQLRFCLRTRVPAAAT